MNIPIEHDIPLLVPIAEISGYDHMKAIAVVPKSKGSARMIDVDTPVITATQVLVKVKLVGLDGTDKEINEGSYGVPPEDEKMLIFGH